MVYLADELWRAFELRVSGLKRQIDDLSGAVGSDHKALGFAFDLLRAYPEALTAAAKIDWDRNPDPAVRARLVRPYLRCITSAASFTEGWLSHGSRAGLFGSLNRAVANECRDLGLGHREVILANGSADNYQTFIEDMDRAFSRGLPALPTEVLGHKYAMIQLPYFHGSDVLWLPILLGHELGHLVCTEFGTVPSLDLDHRIDLAEASLLTVPFAAPSGSAIALLEVANNWAAELLCDANAVRRYGPAGVAALAEFLESLGATDHVSSSHPPGWLRYSLMLKWLGEVTDSRLNAVLEPWQSIAATRPPFDHWVDFLIDLLLEASEDIWSAIAKWAPAEYSWRTRIPKVHKMADELLSGVPCSPAPSSTVDEFETGDIIAAAWIARIEDPKVPVDQLARKSVVDADFLRLWQRAALDADVHEFGGDEIAELGTAGTLAGPQIAERLERSDASRIVVKPLLRGAIGGAAIDVRLSNRFIVFSRSRVASFDPLALDSDPRQIQQEMELPWGSRFVLHPNELVLAATLEYLVVPGDLTAQVITRSSYGRLGLLSATAVQVHPHFQGCLTLELLNLGKLPIELTPGERVAQLIFTELSSTVSPPKAKYSYPTGPEFSKVRQDSEAAVLRRLGQ
jgi:deoxycytidine triphosphate deaminase